MAPFTTAQRIYIVLSALFLTSLLIADVTAGKFFHIGPLEISVGVIPFPIAFILTDVVNEYYGRRGARFMTYLGMIALVFGFLIILTARMLPASAASPVPQTAFDAVFGLSFRFFGASLAAYLLGQLVDIHAFHFYKRLTESRHLWLRAVGSTLVSQIVDTLAVTFAALAGRRAFGNILQIAGISYAYKMLVAVLLTPLVYVAHDILTRRFGIEPAPHGEEVHTLGAGSGSFTAVGGLRRD